MKRAWILLMTVSTLAHAEPLEMWYPEPAARWLEALPVGNGRLGAMVYGGVETERLALNESTCWSGGPSEHNVSPDAKALLPEVRRLLFEDRVADAAPLIQRMLGRKLNYGTHLPFGNLSLTFHHQAGDVEAYRRSLDLDSAVVTTNYRIGDTVYTREVLASHPDQVIAMRLAADRPGRLSFDVVLDGKPNLFEVATMGHERIVLTGQAHERKHSDGATGVNLRGEVQVVHQGGEIVSKDGRLEIRGADAATLFVALGTDLYGRDPKAACAHQLRSATEKHFDRLRQDHLTDHRSLFRRVSLNLGAPQRTDLPTDQRLAEWRRGVADPGLAALFFQFGRYLVIGSSRSDSPVPSNLQGLWNDGRAAVMPWTCDFHLDINTQMNYWPVEVTNLSPCHQPLFRWIEERLVPSGRRTAREMYGCDGWMAQVVSNPWGYSAPGWGTGWAHHTTGGIWIASHLWEHYLFTGDTDFLQRTAYPILKEAAQFFLQHLVEHPHRAVLVSGPSVSPENAFLTEDGQRGTETMGPACDSILIRDLFQSCIDAATVLQQDEAFRDDLEAALARLPEQEVGRHGQLQEWLQDYEEAVPEHRHTTHLISLFPSHQITPGKTPKLARAARVVLDRKKTHPKFEAVEWNLAWFICLYARLADAEQAHENLVALLRDATEDNLFTYSTAGIAGAQENIMVIDGNTGATAGVAEMLLQSHGGEIQLLPALPAAWSEGAVNGLRARGGFEVKMQWHAGRLASAVITSQRGNLLKVRYGAKKHEQPTEPGGKYVFDGGLGRP